MTINEDAYKLGILGILNRKKKFFENTIKMEKAIGKIHSRDYRKAKFNHAMIQEIIDEVFEYGDKKTDN